MGLNGIELIQDCSIELTIGRRYGLIGQNGCGKTSFLQCLANREVGVGADNVTHVCTRGSAHQHSSGLMLLPSILWW
jgi:ATPase subunit of ABC transporter with duplicated ATPase domains